MKFIMSLFEHIYYFFPVMHAHDFSEQTMELTFVSIEINLKSFSILK